MKILIEEHPYPAEAVHEVLHGVDALESIDGYVCLNYVGYFYNTHLQDCVFILPKVLLEDSAGGELVFESHTPEDIINLEAVKGQLKVHQREFIYKFAVWIYRAICVYRNSNPTSSIVYHKQVIAIGKGRRKIGNTFLDILLSLLQWNRENQNFVLFTLRNLHAGYNKINWTRTIAHSTAIVQQGRPTYLDPVNKKRQVNFDEELLVIFYSMLNYIGDHYGFEKQINLNFTLITGRQFDNYLNGYGKRRLQQIKYKYFSDKALELWELCYAFFERREQVCTHSTQKEYLLVKNFNIVFEAIIDDLVGDKNIPKGLAEQADGKRVDHLYTYQSLTAQENDKPIYYIGDSKYYKIGSQIGKNSIYKQFIYARNVIQWNLDLFLDNDPQDPSWQHDRKNFGNVPMLRDEVTEGYDIIPNFFISARINKKFTVDENLTLLDTPHLNKHFKNRLYDRDTLLVCHYDVNFLYVVLLYARNNKQQKAVWKNKVRAQFREKIQQVLQENYQFYAMKAKPSVDARTYIEQNFRKVMGKVYAPFDEKTIYSLALDRQDPNHDNAAILQELGEFFYIEPCPLGTNPTTLLPTTPAAVAVGEGEAELVLCVTSVSNFDEAVAQVRSQGKVGIALQQSGATLHLVEGFTKARYLLLHNKGDKQQLFFLDGKGPILSTTVDSAEMVTTKKDADLYLVFGVDCGTEPEVGRLNLSPIAQLGEASYSPHLLPLQQLRVVL